MSLKSRRTKPPVGSRPGTLVIDAAALAPSIRLMTYTNTDLAEIEVPGVDDLDALLRLDREAPRCQAQSQGDPGSPLDSLDDRPALDGERVRHVERGLVGDREEHRRTLNQADRPAIEDDRGLGLGGLVERESEDLGQVLQRGAHHASDALERKIFGGTKFDDLTRWRTADVFYLVVVPGIIEPGEVPRGWGLLEKKENGELVEERRPVNFEAEEKTRVSILEQIARKATSMTNRDEGIAWEEFHPEYTVNRPDNAEDPT